LNRQWTTFNSEQNRAAKQDRAATLVIDIKTYPLRRSTWMNNKQLSRTGPLVLCIDDDPAIATALSLRLQSYEVRVATAYFGAQGIWLAVTERPDAIVTDLRMPQGHGHYVVECLRSRADTRDVPVIVLTGCRDQDSQKRMLSLGVRHYLHKPIPFDDLLEALATYIPLAQRRMRQAAV
jgi:response regulator RpfG family c-di-GMP phosphodiesterase